MDKVKTSRAIKELTERGVIDKKQDKQDSRAFWLSLNPQGKKLYNQVVPYALTWEDELLSALRVTEYKALMEIFDKLNLQLDEME